jgi:hypothetical protein
VAKKRGLRQAKPGKGGRLRFPSHLLPYFPVEELKERTMPHVIVKLIPGRSEQQKTRLAEEIVKDVVAIAKCE